MQSIAVKVDIHQIISEFVCGHALRGLRTYSTYVFCENIEIDPNAKNITLRYRLYLLWIMTELWNRCKRVENMFS